MANIEVRDVALADTIDLRSRVLRSHLPGVPARSPSDDHPGTWHLGAYRDDRLVGVVTGFGEEWAGRPGVRAQRFRFMAVEPAEHGGGVGRALMEEVIARARRNGDVLLWANGRDTALDFYRKLGFEIAGESFMDATSHLPHTVVVLEL